MANIIICDDDEELFGSLQDFLKSLGHEAVHAADPIQLRDLLTRQKPDLIIMDMQMRRGGGVEGVRTLESEPQLAAIPILFCSGMSLLHLKQWFSEKPNRRYMSKPVDMLLMKDLIAELLRR